MEYDVLRYGTRKISVRGFRVKAACCSCRYRLISDSCKRLCAVNGCKVDALDFCHRYELSKRIGDLLAKLRPNWKGDEIVGL